MQFMVSHASWSKLGVDSAVNSDFEKYTLSIQISTFDSHHSELVCNHEMDAPETGDDHDLRFSSLHMFFSWKFLFTAAAEVSGAG